MPDNSLMSWTVCPGQAALASGRPREGGWPAHLPQNEGTKPEPPSSIARGRWAADPGHPHLANDPPDHPHSCEDRGRRELAAKDHCFPSHPLLAWRLLAAWDGRRLIQHCPLCAWWTAAIQERRRGGVRSSQAARPVPEVRRPRSRLRLPSGARHSGAPRRRRSSGRPPRGRHARH